VLTWREVDLEGGVIRLHPERSTSKLSRVLPLAASLREVLTRRLALRRLETARVFHWNGEPFGTSASAGNERVDWPACRARTRTTAAAPLFET
jgi:integrase